jgi:hypothetical protein
MASKIKGDLELKKTNHWTLQMLVSKHPKDSMYVAIFY